MHTIETGFYSIHFNGDFNGEVIFRNHVDNSESHIHMEALDAFFAERIRRGRIERIESMTDKQVINSCIGYEPK